MYYANQWKWRMNDSHACLTTHVDLADTNSLYCSTQQISLVTTLTSDISVGLQHSVVS